MLALAGDVAGFDSSAGMLELARRRLGNDADLHLAASSEATRDALRKLGDWLT